MKIYIRRSILYGFIASLVVIAALGVFSYLYFTDFIEVTRWSAHARKILYHAEQVRSLTTEIETAQRGHTLSGDEIFLKSYPSAVVSLRSHVRELDSLTADNASQQERIGRLKGILESKIKFAESVVRARRESFEKARALTVTLTGEHQMEEIRSLVNDIQREEDNLILTRTQEASSQFYQFAFTFGGLILATLVILSALMHNINSTVGSWLAAEEKLKQAELTALKINAELEAFSYSISHDLRAPLRSINGYGQILREDYAAKLDEEGNRLILIIMSNAKRMGQLIDDLLDFSKVGRQEMKISKINLDEFVKPIIAELVEFQNDRKIELNIKSLGVALADVSLIRQVWVNLISNALKYSSKKEISRIEVGATDESGETVYYVKDNGAGFNMQFEHKLFGVFQRLHKAKDFEGTGVGLALVKRIVERHKGRIWAQSIVTEGATFFFTLPQS